VYGMSEARTSHKRHRQAVSSLYPFRRAWLSRRVLVKYSSEAHATRQGHLRPVPNRGYSWKA
jgi:hypothetical protein